MRKMRAKRAGDGASPGAALAVICGWLVVLAGCGYTLGARSGGEPAGGERPAGVQEVVVATVAVPADRGVDAGRMTDLLMKRLRAEGVGSTEWSRRRADLPFVDCRLDGPPSDGFGAGHSASIEVDCRITRPGGTTRRVEARARHTTAGGSGPGVVDESITAAEFAATRAIERVAPGVVEQLAPAVP